MTAHPMPDLGTYNCGECNVDHPVLDRGWMLEVGFTDEEAGNIMAEQLRKMAGWKKRAPRQPQSHAERQAAYRARQKLKGA
jgi:hypothetical protein